MNSFNIKLGNSEFQHRQNQILEHLNALENTNRESNLLEPNENDMDCSVSPNKQRQKRELLKFKGRQSIFKKPDAPAPKNYIRRLPDFKINPHKWTKYSLEDVEEVTSESNRKSALNFLKELADRKRENQREQEKLDELPTKIFFNKHINAISPKEEVKSAESEEINSKISYNGSTIIMPEYKVGQKAVKPVKSVKRPKVEKGKELKLDHLFFEDEQD